MTLWAYKNSEPTSGQKVVVFCNKSKNSDIMTFATLYYYIFDDHILLFHVQHNKLYLHQKQKLKNKTALRGGLIAYI